MLVHNVRSELFMLKDTFRPLVVHVLNLFTLIPGARAVAHAVSRGEGAQCHSATRQRDGVFNSRPIDPERAAQATGDSSLGCPHESRGKLDEAGRETSRLALLLSEL